jgi:hypothetical protein
MLHEIFGLVQTKYSSVVDMTIGQHEVGVRENDGDH